MPDFSHFSNREGEAVNYDSFLQTDAVEISVGAFVSLSFEELSAFEIRRPAL